MITLKHLPVLVFSTALVACGGSSNSDNSEEIQKAQFSLGVSDAQVSNVKEVWLAFDGITLKGANDADTSFDIHADGDESAPLMVNIMAYQGADFYQLLSNQEVDVGNYQWLRADIVNGNEANLMQTSHVVYQDDTLAPLVVNRKVNDGVGEIQLDGFVLNQGLNEFVIEFDLKKSLVAPANSSEVDLKPRGVRLENQADTGHIRGTVSEALIANCEADNIALAPETGGFGHAVYVYVGADVEATGDISDESNAPLATAQVNFSEELGYAFEVGFLTPSDYTVAYTCAAHLDDPDVVNAEVSVYQQQNVTVTADAKAEVSFTVQE